MIDLKKLNIEAFEKIGLILDALSIEHEVFGDNIYCKCPIHEGSDNDRGFSISTDKNMWKCWTRSCESNYNNDIFGLVRGVLSNQLGEEASFGHALKFICSTLGVKKSSMELKPKEEEPDDFVKLVKMFSKKNEVFPLPSEIKTVYDLKPPEYFMSRGFSQKTLMRFGVGDCYNKDSDMYQRSVIPIQSDTGKTVAYIGRAIRDYIKPKFLFTSGFDKRFYLYNYHRAVGKALETSCLFLTEGQGDVWRLTECGIENVVGIFGKSLTGQQHLRILSSGITKIVILTDNDQAGRESKIQMQRTLSRHFKLFFPRFSNRDIGEMSSQKIKDKILPQVKGLY
jgi:5S rRNA maturation endonuclease (ribonuclease M5)